MPKTDNPLIQPEADGSQEEANNMLSFDAIYRIFIISALLVYSLEGQSFCYLEIVLPINHFQESCL